MHYSTPDVPVTIDADECASICAEYNYFGLEFGGQCCCDDNYRYEPVSAPGKCLTPCEANANQTCGGTSAIQVYRVANYLDPGPASDDTTTVDMPTTTTIISRRTISTAPSRLKSSRPATFTTITDYITSSNGTIPRFVPRPTLRLNTTSIWQNTTSVRANVTSVSIGTRGATVSNSTTLMYFGNRIVAETPTAILNDRPVPVPTLIQEPETSYSAASSVTLIVTPVPASTSIEVPTPVDSDAANEGEATTTGQSFPLPTVVVTPVPLSSPSEEATEPITATVTPIPADVVSLEHVETSSTSTPPVPPPSPIEEPRPFDGDPAEATEAATMTTTDNVNSPAVETQFVVPLPSPVPTAADGTLCTSADGRRRDIKHVGRDWVPFLGM